MKTNLNKSILKLNRNKFPNDIHQYLNLGSILEDEEDRMIGAMMTHAKRKEYKEVGVNVIILLLCSLIAIGRLIIIPVI